jgi:hypothetical protein
MTHVGNFPFRLGQLVHRMDSSDIGTVIGVLLQPNERAIVRWATHTTYEAPDDLIEMTQAHRPSPPRG